MPLQPPALLSTFSSTSSAPYSPPPFPTLSLPDDASGSLSVAPLLSFYSAAQAWTLQARVALHTYAAAAPTPALSASSSITSHSTSPPATPRTRRFEPYPAPRGRKAAAAAKHSLLISVKAEEIELSLHPAFAVEEEDKPVKSPAERLLDAYDALLYERMESCRRINALLERSARMGLSGVVRGAGKGKQRGS